MYFLITSKYIIDGFTGLRQARYIPKTLIATPPPHPPNHWYPGLIAVVAKRGNVH
jgi:hypothetical protein